jgi:BlaI family transcriptional regulator, penicillinase repressor
MPRPSSLPPLSDAEWKVMNAVWASAGAVSAREILAVLAGDTEWAYTTIKTVMDRLVAKGVLDVEVRRHVSWYRSRLPREQAIASAADDLTRRAFGGEVAPLVHHLVQSRRLSARDRAELRRMLDDTEGRTGRTDKGRT